MYQPAGPRGNDGPGLIHAPIAEDSELVSHRLRDAAVSTTLIRLATFLLAGAFDPGRQGLSDGGRSRVRLFSGRPEIVRDRLTVDQRAVQVDY